MNKTGCIAKLTANSEGKITTVEIITEEDYFWNCETCQCTLDNFAIHGHLTERELNKQILFCRSNLIFTLKEPEYLEEMINCLFGFDEISKNGDIIYTREEEEEKEPSRNIDKDQFFQKRKEMYEAMPEKVRDAMNIITEYFGYGDIENMGLVFSILENANFHSVACKLLEFFLEWRKR